MEDVSIKWFKNDQEIILPSSVNTGSKITIHNNGSELQLVDVSRSDTGAYTCQVYHTNGNDGEVSSGEDVSSLLVQDEPVAPSPQRMEREKLWLFHGNGVTIYNQGCHGVIHELDSRDVIPFNGSPLCSTRTNPEKSVPHLCEWGPNAVQLGTLIYIAQPNLNRIIAFHSKQLVVTQVIATDPQPRELWINRNGNEDRIWVLCHGQPLRTDSKKHHDFESRKGHELIGSFETLDMNWNSPSRNQQLHNKKTVQILRFSPKNQNEHNLIHLQPIDGHFDLIYDLFIPFHSNGFLDSVLRTTPMANNQYAYVTHWDERSLVKIDMDKFKYMKKINLADCEPIHAVFTFYGLVILQCQTPVTHKLNGQLILDQMTDSIISFNSHIRGSRNFLSPDHRFLITVSAIETSDSGIVPSTTIIVQKVSKDGKFLNNQFPSNPCDHSFDS